MPQGFPPDQFHPRKLDEALAPYAAKPNPNRQAPQDGNRRVATPDEISRINRESFNRGLASRGIGPDGQPMQRPPAPAMAPPVVNSPLPKDWKPPVNPNNPPLPQDWKPQGSPTPPSLPPGPSSRTPSTPRRAPGSQAGGFTKTQDGTFATGTNIRLPGNMQEAMQQFQQQNQQLSGSGVSDQNSQQGSPSDFVSQSAQPDMMQMPTRRSSVPQIPGMPTQQQAPYDPTRPMSPSNMPAAPTQQDVDSLNLDAQGGRFGAIDKKYGVFGYPGVTEASYQKEQESLRKAAENVIRDPRFSPEQRAQALERISAKAQENQMGYRQGKEFSQSTFGLDSPPPEEFSNVQPVGLEPVGGNALRNPQTGDLMQATRAPNGMLVPVTADQVEIDSLPEGTQYLDPTTGKIETSGGSGSGRGGRSQSGGTASGRSSQQEPQTPEQLFADYEKWSKKQDEGSTREEQEAILAAAAGIVDPERRQMIEAMAKSDPISAITELQSENIDVDLDSARMKAFKREQDAKSGRQKALGEMFGVNKEEVVPDVDPNKYRIRQGTYGTSVIRRRGGSVDIPAVKKPDGQMVAAPNAMRQLADLESDTPFQNITKEQNGKEVRMLPFEMESINTEDFALPDNVRQAFGSELGRIRARDPQQWNEFSNTLQKYQTVDETWDPANPTPKQTALMKVVGSFYNELNTSGKALMSMYVAHSLGYKVDVNPSDADKARGFKSTGFARDESKGSRVAEAANTNFQSEQAMRESTSKNNRAGYVDAVNKAPNPGEQPSQEFYRSINKTVEDILNQVVNEETDLANKAGMFGPGGDMEGFVAGEKGPGKWNRWSRINTLFEAMSNANPLRNGVPDPAAKELVLREMQNRIHQWAMKNPDSRFGKWSSTAYDNAIKKLGKTGKSKETEGNSQ
jgi:hypothetical protein